MTTQPRLMSGADAAAYCGVTPATFSKWVASGIIPKPVQFTRRWDRKAIDLVLDRTSGIKPPSPAATVEGMTLAEWKQSNETRKAVARARDRNQDAR